MSLQKLNWNARNHGALNGFLAGVRSGDSAVFDWDNTCIFGDIGEAVLRHQTLRLEFKFGPEHLREIIPDRVNGIDHIHSNGRIMALPAVKGQIVSAYEKIFGRDPARIRASAAYRDFSAGLLALNRGLEETPGIGCEFAYPWAIHFLRGFTPDDVRRLTGTVMDSELPAAIRRRQMPDERHRMLYRWTEGIRSFPEMIDLARCLRNAGCRIIISTASNPLLIEAMAQRTGFAADQVIGMAARIENGMLSGTLLPGPAPNFGSGKTENLRRLLDNGPSFAAGDSSGDYEMMTEFPATRLKLLIRRERPGKMASLYQKVLAGDPGYLLQDVDRETGKFSAAPGQPGIAFQPNK